VLYPSETNSQGESLTSTSPRGPVTTQPTQRRTTVITPDGDPVTIPDVGKQPLANHTYNQVTLPTPFEANPSISKNWEHKPPAQFSLAQLAIIQANLARQTNSPQLPPRLLTATVSADGTTVTLLFSEPMTVTSGTGFTISNPRGSLTLTYSSGTGTATLVFTTTAPETRYGENPLVGYDGTGTIVDADGHDLDAFLPIPSLNNSTVSTATLVSATVAANGTTLTLVFSSAISLSSGAGLTLSNNNGTATPTYSSGTGTTSLVFTTPSLPTVYGDTTGTIAYSGAGNMVDGSARTIPVITATAITNNSILSPIDLTSATVGANGRTLTLVFTGAVTLSNATGFTLVTPQGTNTPTYVSGSGTATLVFTAADITYFGDTALTIAYNGGTGNAVDASARALLTIAATAVTNSSVISSVTLSSATLAANGRTLSLVFSSEVTLISGFGFSLVTPQGTHAPVYVSGTGTTTIVFTAADLTYAGDTGVTISYTGDGSAVDGAGHPIQPIAATATTNNSDVSTVELLSATIDTDGVTLTLVFGDNVTLSSGAGFSLVTPQGTNAPVYVSGTGTDTIVFTAADTTYDGDTGVTISYTGSGNAEDDDGHTIQPISATAVTNNSEETP